MIGRRSKTRRNRTARGHDFRLVFTGVILIAVLCLAGSLIMAESGSDAANKLNDTLLTVFKMSCGALIGLLGGRFPR